MRILTIPNRHGLKNAIVFAAVRCVQKCMVFDVSNVMLCDTKTAVAPECSGEIVFRFVEADEVRKHGCERQLHLDESFADRLETGYDFCFGAFLCGQLVGYCFLAMDSIEPDQNRSSHPKSGIGFSFRNDTAFRYKGFVHRSFRGQRIYPQLLNAAAVAMRERGVRHIVSTNEVINFSVRKCLRRVGYQSVGYAIACGYGNQFWVRVSDLSHLGIQSGASANVIDRSLLRLDIAEPTRQHAVPA